MIRQGVECDRRAKDAGCTDNSIGHEEEDADDLLQPLTADNIGHVGDGVAPGVVVAEVALNNGAVGVEELPAQNVDGTWQSTEDIHGGGNSKHAGGEDDCVVLASHYQRAWNWPTSGLTDLSER